MIRRSISWYGRDYEIAIPLPTKQNRETYKVEYFAVLFLFISYIYLIYTNQLMLK